MHPGWQKLVGRICFGIVGIFGLWAASVSAATTAPPEDAAIVVAVSGAVTYRSAQTPDPAPLQAFMKMYQDDLLTLPAAAQVKLLYPAGGRKETWQGPVTLQLGAKESQVQGANAVQPIKVEETAAIARTVKESGLPLIERGAVTIVRAGNSEQTTQPASQPTPMPLTDAEKKTLADAQASYVQMKQAADAGDVTPELYLLSVLAFYEQYETMTAHLTELLKSDPDNTVLQHWAQWVSEQR